MKHETLFQQEEGSRNLGELTVYALSTCGFCRRALAFLRERSIRFRYLYVDDQTPEIKEEIKGHLYDTFKQQVRYPFLVINNERFLIGFTEEEWIKTLGVER
ncbi:MAG: glutaredoxin family protein [Spirochaetes bacterium]|nr:glutaredoxin family protein [Spirochaetota bacterium]